MDKEERAGMRTSRPIINCNMVSDRPHIAVPIVNRVIAKSEAPRRPRMSLSRPYNGVKVAVDKRYDVPSHEAWLDEPKEDDISVNKDATMVVSNAPKATPLWWCGCGQ